MTIWHGMIKVVEEVKKFNKDMAVADKDNLDNNIPDNSNNQFRTPAQSRLNQQQAINQQDYQQRQQQQQQQQWNQAAQQAQWNIAANEFVPKESNLSV